MRALFAFVVILFSIFGAMVCLARASGSKLEDIVPFSMGVIILLLCMITALLIRYLPDEPPRQILRQEDPAEPQE